MHPGSMAVLPCLQLLLVIGLWVSPGRCDAISDDVSLIIDLHNYYRRLVGKEERVSVSNMKKIRWDEELAMEAALRAKCSNLGATLDEPTMDESTLDGPAFDEPAFDELGIPLRGVSIGVGRRNQSIAHSIWQWYNQRKAFDRQFNVCHFGQQCKPFMQLVSADTDRVGCAINRGCHQGEQPAAMFVCVYAQGLNEAGPVFKVGNTCSGCSAPSAFCDDGLCVACDPKVHHSCECRKSCLKPLVGFGLLSKRTCTCWCIFGNGPNCDEECRNPEMYEDFDPCAEVTRQVCRDADPDTRAMLKEFCPEQCSCRAMPVYVHR